MKKLSQKQKNILEIIISSAVLILAIALLTPVVVQNIQKGQVIAVKLESKSNAKESWDQYIKNCSLTEDNYPTNFYWNNGEYYWVIDQKGNILEDSEHHTSTPSQCDSSL